MANINTIIDTIYPANSGTNIIPTTTIEILFDRELDAVSAKENIFITGPDQDEWSGPDLLSFPNRISIGDEDEMLQSPDFRGLVDGTFTIEKVNLNDLDTYAGYDYSGAGNLWRTKVVFTPTNRLSANTTYRVYVTGDEDSTDDYNTGIKTRTVFDTVKGANLGTGEASFHGSYTGTASTDTFWVTITTAGEPGTAKFKYHRGSNPSLSYGPYLTSLASHLLVDGVKIYFEDGTFSVGDSFSCVVKSGDTFSGNLVWPFTTGSASISSIPSTTATTVINTPVSSTTTSTDTFSVSSTTPTNRSTNLSSIIDADTDVSIVFDDSVDSSTVSSSTVSVEIDVVDGDPQYTASGTYSPSLTTNGTTVSFTIPSGMINTNNIVDITLDSSISNTDGVSLGSDYNFYFTSTYSPLYSSVRKVRLEYGAYLEDLYDDTINAAIYQASKIADGLTWNIGNNSINDIYNMARFEFTTCKAAEILLLNVAGAGGGLKSKKLGDLSVSYDTDSLNQGLDKALGCMGKWEIYLNSKGGPFGDPQHFTKGKYDLDRPPVGRQWDVGEYPIATAKSLKSGRARYTSGYYQSRGGRAKKGNTHN